MLLDVLFIYCKLNPDVGYRQGMHEVLAPVLWVISRDAADEETSKKEQEDQTQERRLLHECFDPRFIEHDTFTLFGIIMQTVKSFYEVSSMPQIAATTNPSSSPIVERSRRVHEVYLHQADAELAEHLVTIEILPQIFLIRWIRLLFGREFPFDHVLALWDRLFAEDPSLDLIDLVCVSMLLRIRWQLLDADYSEALTLLLRYPIPEFPNEPSTFVTDALHLRQNIMHGGGAHIITKYSGKTPGVGSGSRTPKSNSGRRLKSVRHTATGSSFSPGKSAARFLQEQGGIENIIQEAAKGVYSRGEKWGVNKALRGAIEGLQSGANPPRNQLDGSRWSLDEGHVVPSTSEITAKLEALKQRNKELAKLLGSAMEELWVQQRQQNQEQEEVLANALSLAIAKVQFVQVYLENSMMPFAINTSTQDTVVAEGHENTAPTDTAVDNPKDTQPQSVDDKVERKDAIIQSSGISHSNTDEASRLVDTSPTGSAPKIMVSKSRPQQSRFHHPRPSLAQSSFSWMLGEDQRKSSFVSSSPFPSDRRAAREKAGFLFGDGKTESEGKAQKGKAGEENADEEVISLGTIKGSK
ncbi:MAG: hypothetical protein Q9166_005133 [cf. Caloplaca sp. 2 TL-2023]